MVLLVYLVSRYWEIKILFHGVLPYKRYSTEIAFQCASKICVGRRNSFSWLAVIQNHSDRESGERISSSNTNFCVLWRPSQSHNFCTKVISGTKFGFPSISSLGISDGRFLSKMDCSLIITGFENYLSAYTPFC